MRGMRGCVSLWLQGTHPPTPQLVLEIATGVRGLRIAQAPGCAIRGCGGCVFLRLQGVVWGEMRCVSLWLQGVVWGMRAHPPHPPITTARARDGKKIKSKYVSPSSPPIQHLEPKIVRKFESKYASRSFPASPHTTAGARNREKITSKYASPAFPASTAIQQLEPEIIGKIQSEYASPASHPYHSWSQNLIEKIPKRIRIRCIPRITQIPP